MEVLLLNKKIKDNDILRIQVVKNEDESPQKGESIYLQLKNEIRDKLSDLRNIDDEEVYIDFGTSISPSVIRSIEDDGDYQYMILPVRLKKD